MAAPTIADRLNRRFLLMTADVDLAGRLQASVPPGWAMRVVTDLDEVGGWSDILLYRFLVLDLDEVDAFDPIEVIRVLRMEYLLQIAVFCFGGDGELQEKMRASRADRFFGRDQIVTVLPQFLAHYGW